MLHVTASPFGCVVLRQEQRDAKGFSELREDEFHLVPQPAVRSLYLPFKLLPFS